MFCSSRNAVAPGEFVLHCIVPSQFDEFFCLAELSVVCCVFLVFWQIRDLVVAKGVSELLLSWLALLQPISLVWTQKFQTRLLHEDLRCDMPCMMLLMVHARMYES